MAQKPIATPLPKDLPENWTNGQVISVSGVDVGLTEKHGYNYLMKKVNQSQDGVNKVNEAFESLETVQSIGTLVHSSAAKSALLDNDMIPLMDSADTNKLKKWSFANLKVYLKNIFMPISGGVLGNHREKLHTLDAAYGFINLDLGNVFQHTPSGNTTYSIYDPVNGQACSFTLIINQTATVRTLNFPASVKWKGGEIPVMSTANKTYVLTFMSVDGGTNWLGMFGGEF